MADDDQAAADSFWNNAADNFKIMFRKFSFYVAMAVGAGLQAFVVDPTAKAQVAEFLGHIGLAWAAPGSGFIVMALIALAQAWPQRGVMAAREKQVAQKLEAKGDIVVLDPALSALPPSTVMKNAAAMNSTQRGVVSLWMLGVLFTAALMFGCSTISDTTMEGYNKVDLEAVTLLDQVTLSATAAIKANVLKGNDADNVISGIKQARDTLAVTRTLVRSATVTPGQGITRAQIATAILTSTQLYLRFFPPKAPAVAASAQGVK